MSEYFRGGPGDDRAWLRSGADSFEPDEGADRAKLGPRGDYVFIWPDESVDVIDCGRGNDLVDYYGAREKMDDLTDCESVTNPDRSGSRSDARADWAQRAQARAAR